MATSHYVFIGLGSNMGDRLGSLRQAVTAVAPYGTVIQRSPVYEAAPLYVLDQPWYFNAVIGLDTLLEPMVLLYTVREIERSLGRQPVYKYGPRLIDLDILFYGSEIISLPELVIPHVSVPDRNFVLRPMADIAPDFVNPRNGKTIAQMLAELPPSPAINKTADIL